MEYSFTFKFVPFFNTIITFRPRVYPYGVSGSSSSEYVASSLSPSNLPLFSTQPEPDNDEEVDVEDNLVEESTPESRKLIRARWTTHETTILCKSWENVTTNN